MLTTCDAVVIGGGFYGVAIAIYLRAVRGLDSVVLIERGNQLLSRASFHNQARIHNGYHYPRSYQTAYRSRINLPRFLADFPDAIYDSFTHLYAIARLNSKISATQFTRFCREIGAKIQPASPAERRMFDDRLIDQVFRVEEMAFNAAALRQWASRSISRCGIRLVNQTQVIDVVADEVGRGAKVSTRSTEGDDAYLARYVFNCTYSGLQSFRGTQDGCETQLKHEIAELVLVRVPEPLRSYGITVMDGPFFSLTPFPARDMHILSHVRYTPHCVMNRVEGQLPYKCLEGYSKQTRFDRMRRDASRYMPSLQGVSHEESLFEVKTVLVENETDDGRPILFERHPEVPGCYSVLGGKIDNIYDIYTRLDSEMLVPSSKAVVS